MKADSAKKYLTSLRQKKLLIPLIIITLLLPILTLYSQQPTENSSAPANPSTAQTKEPEITPQKSALLEWKTYNTVLLSIDYAPDWFVEKVGIGTGGEIITIKPSALPDGINYPQLSIQIEPAKNANLDQKINILKGLGLIESNEKILGIDAKRLSGTVPFKKVNNTVLKEPVQQTAYILSYKNQIITLKYTYEGSQVNGDIETYFTDVIKGIKLK